MILACAISWAVVILGVNHVTRGTDCRSVVSMPLFGAAGASVVVVGGGVARVVDA